MKRANQKVLSLTLIASAILLSACGGGGSGSGSTGSIGGTTVPGNTGATVNSLTLLSGNSMVIPGSISTKTSLLKTLKWTVSPQTPSAGSLVLSNDSCGVVTKSDQVFVPVPGSAATANSGASTWKCDLGVVAPKGITVDTSYKVLLTSTDDKGNSSTVESMLVVKPNPTASTGTGRGTISAGADFAVTAGKEAPLVCDGPTTSSYQWVVTNNGGLPVTLSAYTGTSVKFTAPSVKTPTNITVTCRATDADNNVTTSSVNVTVNPATIDLTLNTAISKGLVGTPGQSIDISGVGSWYDNSGTATAGPVISYNWTLGAGVPTGVTLLSNGTQTTQLYVNPGVLTAPANIPVTLTATSGGQTSQTTVSVLVDPFGPLTPEVDTPAQIVESGKAIKEITANTKTGLYYQWTQVSGVPVILGGASTAKVGFIAPTVTANSDVILRVAMAYSPITPTNPGVYFVDAVVQVQPAPAAPVAP